MTPKEKAKELVSKYIHFTKQSNGANGTIYNSKQCALISVDEIILANPHSNTFTNVEYSTMEYWKEVKQEIENL